MATGAPRAFLASILALGALSAGQLQNLNRLQGTAATVGGHRGLTHLRAVSSGWSRCGWNTGPG